MLRYIGVASHVGRAGGNSRRLVLTLVYKSTCNVFIVVEIRIGTARAKISSFETWIHQYGVITPWVPELVRVGKFAIAREYHVGVLRGWGLEQSQNFNVYRARKP